jgi:hypothetical protein
VIQSSLVLTGKSSINDNSAGAIIAAKGGRSSTISLGRGTLLKGNSAGWLLVADSWQYNSRGQMVISAPHMKVFNTPSGRNVTQDLEEELRAAKPYTATELAQHLPKSIADPSVLSSVDPLENATTFLGEYLQRSLAGSDPGGGPMAVTMEGVELVRNALEGGLLWLRLVNSSLTELAARENIGGFNITARSSTAPAGSNTTVGPRVKSSALEGTGLWCDPPVYDALIRVVGPQSFKMSG